MDDVGSMIFMRRQHLRDAILKTRPPCLGLIQNSYTSHKDPDGKAKRHRTGSEDFLGIPATHFERAPSRRHVCASEVSSENKIDITSKPTEVDGMRIDRKSKRHSRRVALF